MRRGFTLFELMFTVALLAVFAAVATPVLRGAIRMLTAPPPTAAAVRLDAAVAVLRQDVWASATRAAPSPHELTLTDPAGHAVTWHVGPGPRLDRSDGRRWPAPFPNATVAVAVDGPAVRFRVADARGYRGGSVVLPSQMALLGGVP